MVSAPLSVLFFCPPTWQTSSTSFIPYPTYKVKPFSQKRMFSPVFSFFSVLFSADMFFSYHFAFHLRQKLSPKINHCHQNQSSPEALPKIFFLQMSSPRCFIFFYPYVIPSGNIIPENTKPCGRMAHAHFRPQGFFVLVIPANAYGWKSHCLPHPAKCQKSTPQAGRMKIHRQPHGNERSFLQTEYGCRTDLRFCRTWASPPA